MFTSGDGRGLSIMAVRDLAGELSGSAGPGGATDVECADMVLAWRIRRRPRAMDTMAPVAERLSRPGGWRSGALTRVAATSSRNCIELRKQGLVPLRQTD